MRNVMTRVFPLPAPARISTGPSVVSTASRCCGFSSSRNDKRKLLPRQILHGGETGAPPVHHRTGSYSWGRVSMGSSSSETSRHSRTTLVEEGTDATVFLDEPQLIAFFFNMRSANQFLRAPIAGIAIGHVGNYVGFVSHATPEVMIRSYTLRRWRDGRPARPPRIGGNSLARLPIKYCS